MFGEFGSGSKRSSGLQRTPRWAKFTHFFKMLWHEADVWNVIDAKQTGSLDRAGQGPFVTFQQSHCRDKRGAGDQAT